MMNATRRKHVLITFTRNLNTMNGSNKSKVYVVGVGMTKV